MLNLYVDFMRIVVGIVLLLLDVLELKVVVDKDICLFVGDVFDGFVKDVDVGFKCVV